LVSPASAALCAASIACGGDMKSGSPEDRPTIFTPCARSSRTLRVMAAEAEIFTLFRRSAGSNMESLRLCQWKRRTIGEGSAVRQSRRLDSRYANRLVLVARAARGAGRADHGTVLVLDHDRAGLGDELRRGQGPEELRIALGAVE